ncbi:hypothetical protein C8F04DRAFT_1249902 [Mycena alexandri]|uniref:RING-type domain-containing protein n=1 Tax=Mycena alexandri TaxID=1745969 RepID=A0AAD6XGP6_9AGAR|nr:hypothetical protein C8F04DRAFT_1249902 [Mycena alexandri]
MSLNKGKKRARDESDFLPPQQASSSRSSPLSEMSSLSPIPEPEEVDPGPVKKYKKRAETRECPVCSEQIPVRLLQAHAELEAERVEAIIRRVGETDVDFESLDSLEALAETPTRPRLSALRARKSLGAQTASSSSSTNRASTSSTPGTPSALAATLQTITAIKRHRKQRHTKLKELVRSSDDSFASTSSSSRVRETWRRAGASTAGEVTCPVCLANVRGDEDVIEAHVDACLVDQTRRLEEARQAAVAEERERRQAQRRWRNGEEDDVNMDGAAGHVGDVRGTGFATRDPNSFDVDDEIDIDGDDEAAFGAPQFTEGDIVDVLLPPTHHLEDMDVDLDVDIDVEEEETLRELVAQGKVVRRADTDPQASLTTNTTPERESTTPPDDGEADKVDLAILAAKSRGDQASLLGLLQNKIKILVRPFPLSSQFEMSYSTQESRSAATSLCRICIESYTDPTVSTGCWHTCCKECWLRCLGSTKLCPICKRITAATDLRRVYL